ncbi:MAG: hypothetical protein ACYSWU_28965, partial [Planctomycetota bacterium]
MPTTSNIRATATASSFRRRPMGRGVDGSSDRRGGSARPRAESCNAPVAAGRLFTVARETPDCPASLSRRGKSQPAVKGVITSITSFGAAKRADGPFANIRSITTTSSSGMSLRNCRIGGTDSRVW